MISDRLWLSPLWVQWLLRAAIFAVFVGGFVLVMYPMSVYRMGWLLTALAVIGLSTVTSGATAYMRRPIRRRYLDALQGLDRPRSLAALEALRTGEVPADPDVLAAAIRTGALAQAYRRGTTRAQRAARWWIPAVAIATAVVEFLATIPLLGEILIGVALLSVIQSVSRARRVRRMRENLQVLRAAADPGPPAPGDDEVAVALPPRRYWQLMAAVTIPVVVFMTLIYVVGRTTPDCYTVRAAVNMIYDKRQLADPQNMTRGEPDLAAYRAWSDQLRNYAARVSDPRIAPRLRRIADLSAQALAQFAKSRDALVAPPPGYSVNDQEKIFRTTMQALVGEDDAVAAICFPHH